MRIEELILEGFKSYPVRTQITGWDPSFNAITGLNGSGKSNILDAICFVLGLTNMSSVRLPHHLHNTLLLIMSSSIRCAPRINRISYTNVDKPVSPRHLSPSSLTTQIGKTARLGWRTTLR
jgi:structural maintenance of chromosome 2